MSLTRPLFLFLALLSGFTQAATLPREMPKTVNGATTIDVAAAKALFSKGTIFIDVRMEKGYDSGRIPGAVNLTLKRRFTLDNLQQYATVDDPVVIYCGGPRCPLSVKAIEKAVSWGYQKLYYFRDGLPGWKRAGYPVE